jgi:hypothetical protein
MSTSNPKAAYSPFIPLLLIALSVVAILGYQLLMGLEQKKALQKQQESMIQAVAQSKKIQREVEKLAFELLDLSAKDSDAKALIDKYKIARGTSGATGLTP